MFFDKQFLITVLPDAVFLNDFFPTNVQFSIDSRTIEPGQIFFALQGPTFDGHDFITQAIERGAAGIICAHAKKKSINALSQRQLKEVCVIFVADPLDALIRLAHVWRSQFNYPVIAITGSVGKTSTKAMLAQILTLHGDSYLVSYGNQNTLIGIALNMLRMRKEHKGAIFEVGIDRRGQMKQKAALLKPTIALVTGVGHSHMEGLGGIVDIAAEKRDIFSNFNDDNIGVINGDQEVLANVSYHHPIIKFGAKTVNQVQARKINIGERHITFLLKIYNQKYPITLPSNHQGVLFNALAAASLAHLLGVPTKMIIKGIEQPLSVQGRFQAIELTTGKGQLINDCYNASPESMKAALLALQKIDTKACKIAVLGDMLELGIDSAFWHRQLGRFLRKIPSLKHVLLVGRQIEWTKKTVPLGLSVDVVQSWQEAVEKLKPLVQEESLILVKGSHGMNLSYLVNSFTQHSI